MKMTPLTSVTNQDPIILLQLLSLCCDFCILFDSSEPPHSVDYHRNEKRDKGEKLYYNQLCDVTVPLPKGCVCVFVCVGHMLMLVYMVVHARAVMPSCVYVCVRVSHCCTWWCTPMAVHACVLCRRLPKGACLRHSCSQVNPPKNTVQYEISEISA